MARVLNGTSQYLSCTNPISAFPFTVAGWLRRANTTADSVGWVMYQTGVSSYLYGGLLGGIDGDPFRTDSYNASGSGTAATSTGYSANTWTHCASVMTSASSFASLINGGSKGTQSGTWAGDIALCGSFTFGYLNAFSLNIYGQNDVAEFGIWSVALTDSEVASLAKGYSPLEIRPASLVAYYPLGGHYGQSDVDRWKNRHDLTAYNSPTWSDHPRVIYPGPSFAPIKAMFPGGSLLLQDDTDLLLEDGTRLLLEAALTPRVQLRHDGIGGPQYTITAKTPAATGNRRRRFLVASS